MAAFLFDMTRRTGFQIERGADFYVPMILWANVEKTLPKDLSSATTIEWAVKKSLDATNKIINGNIDNGQCGFVMDQAGTTRIGIFVRLTAAQTTALKPDSGLDHTIRVGYQDAVVREVEGKLDITEEATGG